MDADRPSTPVDPSTEFEYQLEELVLSAYGRGATVETTLEFDGPVSDAPGWRVTIEKVPPVERTYDPTLLDE